ncbi:spindle pole body formation-associated protein-domain-containing protein [Cercophora samala]|uniref:Spindle pole body formation-associated protein-domain-containing protein n=1 Tax=Cercophora samala TaxID=330535 RepID=A0AA39ZNG7_9PEZI|nr:spindle pole body formation-associated protein-domain-containing protein [Cercophora samala]
MISWALKRNNNKDADTARDATGGGTRSHSRRTSRTFLGHRTQTKADDTTQLDMPDTPAPVFAVRALKTAIFGTPAARADRRASRLTAANNKSAPAKPDVASLPEKSPAKPPGILLTPGTGAARRKRVSFGHDVKQGSGGPARSSTGELDDPNSWANRPADTPIPKARTKLQQTLENARRNKAAENTTEVKDFAAQDNEQEGAWEEVDDDYDESDYEADITTDLNEPHSRSGQYWKSYFETYHADAKAEMEKLVKYKQLAKSYAKMKDTEADELKQKLREEQEKVQLMEEKLAEMSRQVAARTQRNGGQADMQLVDELNKQTALAREYKLQVEELEDLLHDEMSEEEQKGSRQRRVASPRTHRTLMEAQRELRKARSQLREMDSLREERDRLRSDLKFAEQRSTKLADENKKLSGELSKSSTKIQDLEKNLTESKATYDKLKEDAKNRYKEAREVLETKNKKISELQDQIASLKKESTETKRASRTSRGLSLDEKPKPATDRPSTALQSLETAEEDHTRLLRELKELKRASLQTTTTTTTSTRDNKRPGADGYKYSSTTDDLQTLATSRALRDRIESEFGVGGKKPPLSLPTPASNILIDRANLPDSPSPVGRTTRPFSSSSKEDLVSRPPSRGSTRPRTSRITISRENLRSKSSTDTNESEKRRPLANGSSRTSLVQPRKKFPPPTPAAAAAAVRSLPSSLDNDYDENEDEDDFTTQDPETAKHKIDLVTGKFARLGGGGNEKRQQQDPNSSAVWSTMNASQLAMPADRKAAAIARLQRKKAARLQMERMNGGGDHHGTRAAAAGNRNKENLRPY